MFIVGVLFKALADTLCDLDEHPDHASLKEKFLRLFQKNLEFFGASQALARSDYGPLVIQEIHQLFLTILAKSEKRSRH